MKNTKVWKTIQQGLYSFEDNANVVGTVEIEFDSFDRKVFFNIGSKKYQLKYSGFWKSNFEILNENNAVILSSYLEKWYANTLNLQFNEKVYQLKVRNNPMAEYVVFDGSEEVLAYGLTTENKRAAIKINSTSQNDYLFDFLLWYLFLPIAIENFGNNFVFQSSI